MPSRWPVVPKTKRPKYGNRKVEIGGEKFDSAKEGRRWIELTLLQRAGQISDLRKQVSFDLIVNGMKVAAYVADFVYVEAGATVVEDVKSEITRQDRTYRLKNKLMVACNGVTIREV